MEEKELQQTARAARDAGRAENLQHVKSAIWQNLPPTSPVTAPTYRWRAVLATGAAGMTVAGVAVAAATLWLPGAPMSPAPAFADVERAMQQIKTAQWTETYTNSEKNGRIVGASSKVFNYLRLSKTPLLVRTDSPDGTKVNYRDFDNGQTSLAVYPLGKSRQYVRQESRKPYTLNASATPSEHLRAMILLPRDVNVQFPAGVKQTERRFDLPITTSHTPWVSQSDILNGRKVLRWESVWTIHAAQHVFESSSGPANTLDRTVRLWVDPVTFRVVRREETTGGKHGSARWQQVSSDFRYNVPLRPGIFDIPVPSVGVPYGFLDMTPQGKHNLIPLASEKKAITQVIAKSVDAWNRRDASMFQSTWDLQYRKASASLFSDSYDAAYKEAKEQSRQKLWRHRVTQGEPYTRWRIRAIRFSDCLHSLYARQNASATFPPMERPTIFAALVEAEVQLQPGGKWVPGDAVFELHRDGNHFGITGVTMYKKKLLPAYGGARFQYK